MTVAIGALLLLVLLALALLGGSTRPEPRTITADDEPRRAPDDFEIHVTDYRGDVEDTASTGPAPWLAGVALTLAAIAAALLGSDL